VSTVLWWWSRPWIFIWGPMSWASVAGAALIFAVGIVVGSAAEDRDIGWLTACGRWVLARLEAWLARSEPSFAALVFLIWSINGLTAAMIILSAWLGPLPLIVLLAAGINTGVMARRTAGKRAWIVLAAPHAWIELPAIITAAAAATQAGLARLGVDWFDLLADTVWAKAFLTRVTLPLLLGAALLEAGIMISTGGKR